jgi:UDP-N-acetylmuramyl pentapeptide phosphotransferase/UDP-N-acetylglucosamine-1-phosphate transferase
MNKEGSVEMISEGSKNSAANWGATLLPTMAVVLFYLLHLKLRTPTAAGLAFLGSALVAYLLFPKLRLRRSRLVLALALAALAAALLGALG